MTTITKLFFISGLIALVSLFAGCDDEESDDDSKTTDTTENETNDQGGDADADADADTDADTDTDADGDADTVQDSDTSGTQDGDLWEATASVMMTSQRFKLTLRADNSYTLEQASGSMGFYITMGEEEGTWTESESTITLTPTVCKEPDENSGGMSVKLKEVECSTPIIEQLTREGDTLTAENPEDQSDTLAFTKQ